MKPLLDYDSKLAQRVTLFLKDHPSSRRPTCFSTHTFWNGWIGEIWLFVFFDLGDVFSEPFWNRAGGGPFVVDDPVNGGAADAVKHHVELPNVLYKLVREKAEEMSRRIPDPVRIPPKSAKSSAKPSSEAVA